MKELKLFVKLFGEMLYKCYLCNVFFIVLDFKVNKDWSKALLLFFCPYLNRACTCLRPLAEPLLSFPVRTAGCLSDG